MKMPVTGEEKIIVEPQTALSDQLIRIRLEGFRPSSRVTLFAEMTDDLHTVWESHAVFTADALGTVDLAKCSPESGTYEGVEAMGLFWSMAPQGVKDLQHFARKHYSFFIKNELAIPSVIALRAFCDGTEVASSYLERLYMAPGVTFHDVRKGGVVGRLYELPSGERRGALILVGGSDGPRMDGEGALLASHGFSAFAIKYFGEEEELPRHLCAVPIEYFKKCIDYLKQKTGFSRVGFLGRSKGAEVALITASLFPGEVGVVIANIPSSVVLFGIKSMRSIPFPPAWTYEGKSLPYLNVKVKFHDLLEMTLKLTTGKKFSFADYHRKAIEDQAAFEQAVIRVENLQCPLLLVSAADDNIWPSSFYCGQIMERLKKFNFPYPHEHWDYEKAGHYIGPAHWPASMTDYWKVPGYKLAGPAGGDAKHNARAAEDFWKKTLQFLDRHLAKH